MTPTHRTGSARTPGNPQLDALNGLSVGDALGAQFFVPANAAHFAARTVPPAPWPWTDDTEMACSVHAVLTERGAVDTFDLVHSFARRHDFDRGYGPAANRLLRLIREGGDPARLAAELFDGQGSYGNGAAMRVAPLGAAFADDPAAAVRPAADTAVVTHTHPQAVAGTVAVAVAAAYAVRARTEPTTPHAFLAAVRALTPPGAVHAGLGEAIALLGEPDARGGPDPRAVAAVLGNGSRTSAADTVPYALWCAARWLGDYPAAVRAAIRAGGDMDTVAAITGGVVAARTGTAGIPAHWLAAREPLPHWAATRPGSVAVRPTAFDPQPLLLPRPCPVPDVVWSDRQWQRLRAGVRPQRMEHRWFTYTAEGVLHLHRSWTGHTVWEVRVAPVPGGPGGGWRPVSALAEGDPSRFGAADSPELLADMLRSLAGP